MQWFFIILLIEFSIVFCFDSQSTLLFLGDFRQKILWTIVNDWWVVCNQNIKLISLHVRFNPTFAFSYFFDFDSGRWSPFNSISRKSLWIRVLIKRLRHFDFPVVENNSICLLLFYGRCIIHHLIFCFAFLFFLIRQFDRLILIWNESSRFLQTLTNLLSLKNHRSLHLLDGIHHSNALLLLWLANLCFHFLWGCKWTLFSRYYDATL